MDYAVYIIIIIELVVKLIKKKAKTFLSLSISVKDFLLLFLLVFDMLHLYIKKASNKLKNPYVPNKKTLIFFVFCSNYLLNSIKFYLLEWNTINQSRNKLVNDSE